MNAPIVVPAQMFVRLKPFIPLNGITFQKAGFGRLFLFI